MDVAATSLDASASARAHRASTEAMARARVAQCPVSFLASDADATARMTASASGREGGWSWEGFVARARRAGERARAGAGRGVEREAVRDAGETAGGGADERCGARDEPRGSRTGDVGVFTHARGAVSRGTDEAAGAGRAGVDFDYDATVPVRRVRETFRGNREKEPAGLFEWVGVSAVDVCGAQ